MYIENYVKGVAQKIIAGKTNPIDIINSKKNISLSFLPLSDKINGYYKYISKKKQIIVINEDLIGAERDFALFHELGHYELKHKGRLLLNCKTINYAKEEYEADLFATYCFMVHNEISKSNINGTLIPKRANQLIYKYLE